MQQPEREGDFLSEITGEFDRSCAEALAGLDIRSYSELWSVTKSFGRALSDLGLPVAKLSSLSAKASSKFVTRRAKSTRESSRISTGAKPPRFLAPRKGKPQPRATTSGKVEFEKLDSVNVSRLPSVATFVPPLNQPQPDWRVRDQGDRGTCVAFAAAAFLEIGDEANTAYRDLSEQFLYWACKARDGDPTESGTWLEFAGQALASDGICEEVTWPYVSQVTQPEGGATPDPSALDEARGDRRTTDFSAPVSGAAQVIVDRILAGRATAVSLPVYATSSAPNSVTNWDTDFSWEEGKVFHPIKGSFVDSGHAVCIVGIVPDSNEPSGGYFVFRNSWGPDWAELGGEPGVMSPARGYGYVSLTYVENLCWELLSL